MEWSLPLPKKDDFVTNIRYHSPTDLYLLIHDYPSVDALHGLQALRTHLTSSPSSAPTIAFETPVYDVLAVSDCLLSSNCNMPVSHRRLS